MPLSSGQGGDLTLIRTGAHKITIDAAGTPVVAGFTMGSLALTMNVQKRQVYVAEFGQTPVDEEILGIQASIQFSLPERSLKVFDIAFNGLYPTKATANSRGIGRSGIQRASERGKSITMHPIAEGSSTARDIVLHKVLLAPTGQIEYSDQGDQVIQVGGMCVVDLSKSDGNLLLSIGETSAGA